MKQNTQKISKQYRHRLPVTAVLSALTLLLGACSDEGQVSEDQTVTTQDAGTAISQPLDMNADNTAAEEAADAGSDTNDANDAAAVVETGNTVEEDSNNAADSSPQNDSEVTTADSTPEATPAATPIVDNTPPAEPVQTQPVQPQPPAATTDNQPVDSNFTFANTTLAAFKPAGQPIASSTPPPSQPVSTEPEATVNSPPIPPVTQAPDGFDQSSNSAPYFENLNDQVVFAGQTLRLRVIPRDADQNVPGMFTGPLPEGARFVDNFDGTKNIEWRPLEPDVGLHTIDIIAVDAVEPLYRTLKTVRLFVQLPDDLSTIVNLPPAIDRVQPHRARAGDLVNILVKGTDPNGHVPRLEILTPQANSVFETFIEDDKIMAFRWQTSTSDVGNHTLRFRVTDARDASMTAESSIELTLSNPNEFIRPGPRLRTLAENRDFHIGYAMLLNWNDRPDVGIYEDTAASEYSMLTTENSLKWGQLNPEPNVWRWDAFDREMQFAYRSDQLVHGHTLVWHRQLPEWIQTLPTQSVEPVMLDFISYVVGRYGAHVALWDVVNESFEDDGSFRRSVWYNAMGEGYIEKAFRQARIHSPLSRLIYNDYDVAFEGPKADAMYNLVSRLLADGVPIDGVGFQMHLDTSFDRFDSVRRNFQRFADLGIEIFITELDVSQFSGPAEERQASIYREVMSICLEQPACKAAQLWGMTDRYSWRRDFQPLPLDGNFNTKPAYFSLQQRLSE